MARFKTEAAEFVRALIVSWSPVGPTMWLPMATSLSRGPGWMPSMLLLGLFGTTMFVNALVGRWLIGPIVSAIGVATWLTWGLVSCLGMSNGCVHSVGNIRHLGLRSLLRFRLWFELAHLAWHGAFLGFVAAASLSFVGAALNLKPVETIAWSAGKTAVESLLLAFAITGTIGYALAFARCRIPTGRAFDCVNVFLPLASGGYLIVCVFDRWPPARVWPDGIIIALVGLVGVLILGASLAVTLCRMQQWETRAKARSLGSCEEARYHPL